LALVLNTAPLSAQLTVDQKLADFQYMAGVYAKRYGPYEWKRDALKFDLLSISPWLERVRTTNTDLEYFDIASEYVSSLNDAHDVFELPSLFVARLNFSVDIYDGKLVVDFINRQRLPAEEYPFLSGYELVSIDGEDAMRILDRYVRYSIAANPRSTRRIAASMITTRPQQILPSAPNVPELSTVVFRQPDGQLETYRIPWAKAGLPLTGVGPRFTAAGIKVRSAAGDTDIADPPVATEVPEWQKVLARLQNCQLPNRAVLNFGATTPVFAASLPAGWVQRLGPNVGDPFFSGSFPAGGLKFGFIRIPSFSPADALSAIGAFEKEIAWFQANTDGLIVDEMRNPGGSVAYTSALLSYLMPATWRSIGFEVRATSDWIVAISSSVEQAKAQRAPQSIIDLLQQIKGELIEANHSERGRTKAIPLDDVTFDRAPAMDDDGNVIAYTKPLMLLVDEFSASAADLMAATIQDNARGPVLGWRTMGAGGNVEPWDAGSYSEAVITVTESLMVRKNPIATSEYPTSAYIENIGVRPDIEVDYMTRDNLIRRGQGFVDAFVGAMFEHIQRNR
jgi:hypothetical protein